MKDLETRHALALALAHEIGNHLAGIRLEAHLLDESLGAAELARASLAIDGLAGQAAPLLGLLRPLLAPGGRRAGGPGCGSLLEGVRRQLEEEGAVGQAIVVDVAGGELRPVAPIEGLHALLLALIGPPAELRGLGESIGLRLVGEAGGVSVVCELPGDALAEAVETGGKGEASRAVGASGAEGKMGGTADSTGAWASGLRGRALVCAIGRILAADAGGSFEVRVERGRSVAVLHLRG